MRPTIREQITECIDRLEQYQMILEDRRDEIWQDGLIWWMCKAVCLLLVEELKRREE